MLSLQSPEKPGDPQESPKEQQEFLRRRPADLELEGRPQPAYINIPVSIYCKIR